jgi:putative ABC transport system permease protein
VTIARKTALAWHNLWHQPLRTAVAVVGVTFAAVLMFMQLGFLEAVKASATVIYDVLEFDICLRSRDYDRFSDARSFDRARLSQARDVDGVESGTPLWVGVLSWRNPKTGEPRAILTLGVPEGSKVFNDSSIQHALSSNLDRPQTMLLDTHTRREFGPANGREFGPADIGQRVEINNKLLEIAGLYTCGTGLNAGGAIIIEERDFLRCVPQFPPDGVSLALIDVNRASDPRTVARQLAAILPEDVEVLTRAEVMDSEIRHWVWETNYGLIFMSGVVVAVVVGTAIVYQVLSSEVVSRLPEYATLKALGYDNAYLVRVMVEQSLLLALVAFLASLAISSVLYEITAVGAQIPIRMTWTNSLLVLALTSALCIASGIAAIRRAFLADPAELF